MRSSCQSVIVSHPFIRPRIPDWGADVLGLDAVIAVSSTGEVPEAIQDVGAREVHSVDVQRKRKLHLAQERERERERDYDGLFITQESKDPKTLAGAPRAMRPFWTSQYTCGRGHRDRPVTQERSQTTLRCCYRGANSDF